MHGKRPLRQASVRVRGGVVMGKGRGVGGVYRDRRGQKIENKTDRQMFSLSFFSFLGRGQAPVHDITFHIPHEHFLAQQISSSCSLRRVPAALSIKCNARKLLRFDRHPCAPSIKRRFKWGENAYKSLG